MKKAIITGVTGQDGSYLAELLLEKGYTVYGLVRRGSTFNRDRIEHIRQDNHSKSPKFILKYTDLTDASSVTELINDIQPDEIYHLGAQSHVHVSFEVPIYTAQATGMGSLHILEAVRKFSPHTKIYQASSSEMFGKVQETPQKETTPFHPRSPYGCAKVFAFWATINYRESFDMFACNGILFNHESPRRGAPFVTRKITISAANVATGDKKILYLGNLDAKRDWGYAPEYVDAMWRILQQKEPQDFVIATGETHSVREFVETAYKEIGVTIRWEGKDEEEKGLDEKTGEVLIAIDPHYYRPAEVDLLIGDASKAKKELDWKPKVKFEELVKIMVTADIKAIKNRTEYKFR